MNLSQALASIRRPIALTASTSSKCSCRGECSGHIGPCYLMPTKHSDVCASCFELGDMSSAAIIAELNAGGPGSGRHKMGISDLERASVMHLRRNGFKSSKSESILNTHAYSKIDSGGNKHVFNLSKSGFTHSKIGASSIAKGNHTYQNMGEGKHKELPSYVDKMKQPKAMAAPKSVGKPAKPSIKAPAAKMPKPKVSLSPKKGM